MIRSIFTALALTILLPVLCFAAPIAQISKLNGTVAVILRKTTKPVTAKADQQLSEGDKIKTGKDGWVELKLADNSRITLANNTELELTSLTLGVKEKRGVFTLANGKMRATVTKLAGLQTDFKVKSPTAVAGIKGTEFLMLARGPANVFFGNEGTVSVAGTNDKGKPLTPQTMTQNTRGLEPVDPVKVEPETPLAEAKAVFEDATAGAPPASWAAADNMPNIIARWNINYGNYLADTGKYEEALQIFQIALDLTSLPEIGADARLGRGAVYGRFLNKPENALDEYVQVLDGPPVKAERALFYVGQALMEIGKKEQAAERFRQYLQKYPEGEFRSSAETLLKSLQQPPPEKK